MRPTLFDRYIAVDWSVNNKPKIGRDSIWAGTAAGGDDWVETLNIPRELESLEFAHPAIAAILRELPSGA